ncbi:MAG: folylpolyglutamate synthase/dihydrofolate synthase family protein [Jaaginema sp. PMC 1079.18]|nr:folylpolyglutamate synthase/dihydrofolate synthase family protein [Jaaginema sp. PMC 1080.18]MEC4850714.1 folylpolyglutamate synthase/dihydrofolate synthase family protein [Jaaginema sp. PMC 1079.18]MEC4867733.1 folylpolyglutamate synthase/dihydrofolate synthase family protein [Jaaginema sp. PMC 1078.18]
MSTDKVEAILSDFQRFGVHLGLDRIKRLLSDLDNPQNQYPIVHVAGTNGKGSVCAYLSSVLTAAGYKVGRYTSPHLINWTERICLNEQAISSEVLASVLETVTKAIAPDLETPTLFEVLTAAAWLYFAQEKVDIAVIEVGLGGRLDATNVCDRPLVTVITSLSLEHWQSLGLTLAAIAGEKAGILKPACPAVIGQLPPEAKQVVLNRLNLLNCPSVWIEPSRRLEGDWARFATYHSMNAAGRLQPLEPIEYQLGLQGDIQLINSAIAIATLQILQQYHWRISLAALQSGIKDARWQGRIQWTEWKGHRLLIDGAHNTEAAIALRQYVDTLPSPQTWIIGILSTKDHQNILRTLLRSGDTVYFVPVPDHSTASPGDLAQIAQQLCPGLTQCEVVEDVFAALDRAIPTAQSTILSGSLYLIGYFLKHQSCYFSHP